MNDDFNIDNSQLPAITFGSGADEDSACERPIGTPHVYGGEYSYSPAGDWEEYSDTTTKPYPPLALYIHWPFCKSKCPYCDFNSHVREQVDALAFEQAMLCELEAMAARVPNRQLVSIFFGGGTPSLMPPSTVEALINRAAALFQVEDISNLEITLEANPTSVEAEKFRAFRASGVNRVSLGVQSLEADALKFLGREHSAGEALRAVELAAEIFPRYSFDLIYALPGQRVQDWEKQLERALTYASDHLSLYQLTIEENTAFHHSYHQQKAFALPEENEAARLYEVTQNVMEAYGLPAYEISNHARAGAESCHNLAYWLGHEYLGVGAGAHGRIRDANGWGATQMLKSPERWLQAVQRHGHGLEVDDAIADRDRFDEWLMMRTRVFTPIPLAALHLPADHPTLAMLHRENLIRIENDALTLTRRGRLVQQGIVGELLG